MRTRERMGGGGRGFPGCPGGVYHHLYFMNTCVSTGTGVVLHNTGNHNAMSWNLFILDPFPLARSDGQHWPGIYR